ncbi:MAG: ribonuclease III [Minisyncoccia bacterium]
MTDKISINFKKFEETLGFEFKDKGLLKQAFTHRSYINENRNLELSHNERLEFLGDAVLEMIVTEYLYAKYPNSNEGDLTAYRASLVNATILSEVARRININEFLLLSRGEAKDIGKARQYILANAIEAVIGAVYLDQGYEAVKSFIAKNLFILIDKIVEEKSWIDSKSLFQEKAQEYYSETPVYKTVKETGPDHDKHFTVAVYVGKEMIAEAGGKSKQEAEQATARKALEVKEWL